MATKADFIGFQFGDWHSSDHNIIRVSDGDRFNEELMPEVKDITVEVPGMHGEYFFGSTYGTRTFTVSIAYDHLTEDEIRRLRKVFGRGNIGQLIFDERPYKKYMAKIESPIELSYICFDEPKRTEDTARDGVRVASRVTTTTTEEIDGEEVEVTTTTINREQVIPYKYDYTQKERIYKGEGTITFICYFPFAKSVYKQLPFSYQKTNDETINEGKKYFTYDSSTLLYTLVEEPVIGNLDDYYERVNKSEVNDWASSSGILSVNEYEDVDKYVNGNINVYNAGDMPTGFRLYIPFTSAAAQPQSEEVQPGDVQEQPAAASTLNPLTLTYSATANADTVAILKLKEITQIGNDVGILIDTNNGLITGVSSFGYTQDGNAQYTTSGNLYNQYVDSGYFFKLEPNLKTDGATIEIDGGVNGIEIFYDYLYF